MRKLFAAWILGLVMTALPTAGRAVEAQLVSGAGPSTKIVQLFFEHFGKDPACRNYSFTVPAPSIKHRGGIQASDTYLFGRTGRPLNTKERGIGKEEIFLAKVPITFAVGLETGVQQLTLKQIEQIFTRRITNWKEVGGNDGQILLVGREATEALFSTLKRDFPFFREVTFDRIFRRDPQVVKFLMSPAGRLAIGFGAQPNFRKHNQLRVEGFSSGVSLGLAYDLKNADHPVVRAARAYAASDEWKRLVRQAGLLPAG
ncbi:periplasmic binding family protein [Geothermobacter ehrlichii]|uniref:Periplasmic binding family protein n=1 Tax=Geothermobacter ehrlichii TaxID=213224 RepID=A0A5D3WMH0_9BACT|nr:substrate-binding domain-containing protein [Geothermobacter ehrlichii]TYO98528.1 periplasmic binding family protein [Geothermobacter ehrlichii]